MLFDAPNIVLGVPNIALDVPNIVHDVHGVLVQWINDQQKRFPSLALLGLSLQLQLGFLHLAYLSRILGFELFNESILRGDSMILPFHV